MSSAPWQGGDVPDYFRFTLLPPALHATPPLKRGVLYRITFDGTYVYETACFLGPDDQHLVDAVYCQDI